MEQSKELPKVVTNNVLPGIKIQDINMPFFSLVGLLIKIWLAAIVATIVVALVPAVIFFGISLIIAIVGGFTGAGK